MSKDRDKERAKKWKEKALVRGAENNALRKRVVEVTASRDMWRSKFYGQGSTKPAVACGYWHNLQVVWLSVLLQGYGGMSLRSCRHSLGQMLVVLNLAWRVPSIGTIRNWVIKCGYHEVEVVDRQQGDWVVWMDESIFLAGEQLLLVLGMDKSKWAYKRGVGLGDVCVLAVRHQSSWDKDQIAKVLEELQGRMKIAYGISDRAQVLRAAFQLARIPSVSDCTHVVANILEKQYKKDEQFMAFTAWAGKLRAKWAMSKDKAPYMPPAQRTQARFANVFPLIRWACKIMEMEQLCFMGLPDGVGAELRSVKQYKSMLLDLQSLQKACSKIFKILKNTGLCKKVYQKIKRQKPERKTPKVMEFHRQILIYLKENLALVKQHGTILCCSDIIESAFGKFKLKVNPKSPNGLTQFVYSIANFGQQFSQEQVKVALEKTRQKDIQKKQDTPKSTAQIRREFFAKSWRK